jgi:polar amino acid transport system substrate-binding protein
MFRISRLVLGATILALVIGACGGTTASPSPGAGPTPWASPIATVPSDQLLFADKLVICSDMPYAPQEYFDANGKPIGSDIEIGQGIASRLGLTMEVVNSYFDTIIPALTAPKCDIIISAMNINPDRLDAIDLVPYFQAGQAFLVQKGNPDNIQTAEDLCGKKVAVQAGTTMLDYISGTGDYSGAGLTKLCSDAGKAAPDPKTFAKDPDAAAALQAGTADAYMGDLPVAIGYADAQPDAFEVAPVPQIEPIMEGIGVAKTNTGLRDAVKAALLSMIADGSYLQALTNYKVQGGAITADQVNAPQQ